MIKPTFKKALDNLLDYLARSGLSKVCFRQYKFMCNELIRMYESHEIESIDDYISYLYRSKKKVLYVWNQISMAQRIHAFVENGVLPIVHRDVERYNLLPQQYKEVMSLTLRFLDDTGKSPRVLQKYKELMRLFFYHLFEKDVIQLCDVAIAHVESFFCDDNGIKRGRATASDLRYFLRLSYNATNEPHLERISLLVPNIKGMRENYPILSKAELQKIEQVILDRSNELTLSDRAISALAFYTGMRSGDICLLRHDNFNWKDKKIVLKQAKTGKEITICLDPVFGNVVYEYIVNERPKVPSPYIFIRKKNHKRIDSHVIYKVSVKLFFLAGIRIKDGRRGMHILRHSFASALIEHDAELPIVSAALGHSNVTSSLVYLNTDEKRLKKCGIDLPVSMDYSRTKYSLLLETVILDLCNISVDLLKHNVDKSSLAIMSQQITMPIVSLKDVHFYDVLQRQSIKISPYKILKYDKEYTYK